MKPSSLLDKMLISPKNNTVIQTGVWIFHFFFYVNLKMSIFGVWRFGQRDLCKKKKRLFSVLLRMNITICCLYLSITKSQQLHRESAPVWLEYNWEKKMKICHVTVKSSFKSNLTEIWISRLSGVTFKSLYSSAEVTPFQITVSVVVCVTCVMYV